MELRNRLRKFNFFLMVFIVSEKEGKEGILLVITDPNLIGKKFVEGRVKLDFKDKFYQGKELELDKVKRLIQKARYLHLSGKESVNLGIKLNIVDISKILYVNQVPHAEVLLD